MTKSEKEKMLSGELYLAGDQEITAERKHAKTLLHRLNVTEYLLNDKAREILNELLPNAPQNIYIEPPFHCDYGYNLYCGDNVYFNVNCVVLDTMKIVLGSNVFCGPGVHIYTATHPLNAVTRRTVENSKPVVIGDDCWIGGGAIICPGVTIGNRCVIGAGSVVTRDIPDDSLAVGNPATVIRQLNK